MPTVKTPNKGHVIQQSDERRLVGILPGSAMADRSSVEVVYARPCIIDGYHFDMVEREFVVTSDLVKLKGGHPAVVQALFNLAVQSAMIPFGEILRILGLRGGRS
jgi:hypothetical protein